MAYRDAIVVKIGTTEYAVDVNGNVERKPGRHKFKGEMTEETIQRVRQKAADLRAVRDEAERRQQRQERKKDREQVFVPEMVNRLEAMDDEAELEERRERVKNQMIGILRG